MRPGGGRSPIVLSAIVCAWVWSAAVSVRAQETINSASVSGRVTDPQNAVVTGALVMAKQTETNVQAETTTDSEGRFRFASLKIGPYAITVHAQGFATATRTLTLTVGSAFDVSIPLTIENVTTDVTVTGNATIVEAARSQIAGTVSAAEAQSLPMNGRQFLDLALLMPDVSPTNTSSNQLFAETSAGLDKDCRLGANATSPTASSWTASPLTTTPQG